MPDPPLRVHEVERGPSLVAEGTPDREVVVHRDWIVHAHLHEGGAYLLDLVLERELRRVCADQHQPVVPVLLGPGADIGEGAQPVDAREGAELDDDDLPPEPRRRQGLRVEPSGGAAEVRQRAFDGQLSRRGQRSDLKVARSSSERICGCSQAAKWPPSSTSLKWMSLRYACSAQLRGAG